MHGVNYAGRFIPEPFLGLYGTEEILFKGVQPGVRSKLSLCDVNTSDSGMRMTRFLDLNIKEEHFALMAKPASAWCACRWGIGTSLMCL